MTLLEELATWNWFSFDAKQHYHADFDGYWYLSRALAALGLNTRPAQDGGQNTAYRIEHWDPNQKDSSGIGVPGGEQRYTVEGKEYRVSVPLCIRAREKVGEVLTREIPSAQKPPSNSQ
jgi:hypothetical protein